MTEIKHTYNVVRIQANNDNCCVKGKWDLPNARGFVLKEAR